jgi:hypothetical protein
MRFALSALAAVFIVSTTAPALATDTIYHFRVPVELKRLPEGYKAKVACTAYGGANETGTAKNFGLGTGGTVGTEAGLGSTASVASDTSGVRDAKVDLPFAVMSYACTLSLETPDNKTITDPSKLPSGWSAVMSVSGNVSSTTGNQ